MPIHYKVVLKGPSWVIKALPEHSPIYIFKKKKSLMIACVVTVSGISVLPQGLSEAKQTKREQGSARARTEHSHATSGLEL